MERDFSSTDSMGTNSMFVPRESGQSQPSSLPPHTHRGTETGRAPRRQRKPTQGHHSDLRASQNQERGGGREIGRCQWEKLEGRCRRVLSPLGSEAAGACLARAAEGGLGSAAPAPQLGPHFHSGLGPLRLCRACSVRCTTSFHWSSEIWLAQAGMPRVGSFTLAIVLFTSSTCSASMGMELRLL